MSKNGSSIANLSIARPTAKRSVVESAARAFTGDDGRLVRLSVDVPPELRKGLKRLSAAHDRPVRELVIEALRSHFAELS